MVKGLSGIMPSGSSSTVGFLFRCLQVPLWGSPFWVSYFRIAFLGLPPQGFLLWGFCFGVCFSRISFGVAFFRLLLQAYPQPQTQTKALASGPLLPDVFIRLCFDVRHEA